MPTSRTGVGQVLLLASLKPQVLISEGPVVPHQGPDGPGRPEVRRAVLPTDSVSLPSPPPSGRARQG